MNDANRKSYIAAFDQGTTSSRCLIFDHSGAIVALAQQEIDRYFPRPGWVEQDAMDIWSSQIGVFTQAMSQAGIVADQISAIGITNQRETTVVWDRRTGKPISMAPVWQCRRGASLIDQLVAEGHGPMMQKKTGLVPDAYFSASKIRWILDNVEGARAAADAGNLAFGTIDSWLIYKLTGGPLHSTDYTNASRTLLFNIQTLQWDDDLLDLFDIPASMLPQVKPSSGLFGMLQHDYGTGIPICGVLGDQQAALFGQCCFEPGLAKATYGTGCFVLMNTGKEVVTSTNGLLSTIAYSEAAQRPAATNSPCEKNFSQDSQSLDVSEKDRSHDSAAAEDLGIEVTYALEGSVYSAGSTIKWLRDELHMIQDPAETDRLALSVEDNGGVYLVPAFNGLGAPYWESDARGIICGLSQGSKLEHVIRAALESLGFQACDVIEAMNADAPVDIVQLNVDGGVSHNHFAMQFQADILGIKVIKPKVVETTAMGAAFAAGLGCGFWQDKEDLRAHIQIDRVFTPTRSAEEVSALRAGWADAIMRCRR